MLSLLVAYQDTPLIVWQLAMGKVLLPQVLEGRFYLNRVSGGVGCVLFTFAVSDHTSSCPSGSCRLTHRQMYVSLCKQLLKASVFSLCTYAVPWVSGLDTHVNVMHTIWSYDCRLTVLVSESIKKFTYCTCRLSLASDLLCFVISVVQSRICSRVSLLGIRSSLGALSSARPKSIWFYRITKTTVQPLEMTSCRKSVVVN